YSIRSMGMPRGCGGWGHGDSASTPRCFQQPASCSTTVTNKNWSALCGWFIIFRYLRRSCSSALPRRSKACILGTRNTMPEPFEFLILNLPERRQKQAAGAGAKKPLIIATVEEAAKAGKKRFLGAVTRTPVAAQAAAWYAAGAAGVVLDAADPSWAEL